MSDSDFPNDSMLELYLFEATGLLDQLDDILLQSESDNSLTSDNINEIFRIMHTIKGSSAMMSYNLISKVAHKVEDMFSIIRDNGVPEKKYTKLFDLVLKVSDFLKGEIKKIQDGEELEVDNAGLEEEVQSMLDDFSSTTPAKEANIYTGRTLGESSTSQPEKPSFSQPKPLVSQPASLSTSQIEAQSNEPIISSTKEAESKSEPTTYFLHVYFNDGSKMENIRAFMLVNKLNKTGIVNTSIPSDLENNADSAIYIIENGFYCSYTTDLSREEIETISKGTLSVESVSFMKKMPDVSSTSGVEQGSPTEPGVQDVALGSEPEKEILEDTTSQSSESDIPEIDIVDAPLSAIETKEVELSKSQQSKESTNDNIHSAPKSTKPTKQNLISVDLNKLDNLMDLVGELVITESMVTGNPELSDLELDSFRKSARQLNKLTDELQDIVMSVRLVPISSVFQKMRRIVRDMSRDLDKDVELVLIGENTEVDKTILDALGDPIMHLVRNAMDHAIENKEERDKLGKSSTGHIILSAQNMGGDIIISISDDGKGLDPANIMEKAKEKNLLTKPEAEYTDKEIFNLLMTPGFSTKENVTEYSGRGVGMDVVKMNIKDIGGSVIIESVKGLGTNIFLKIPVTLAIIPCMEIRVNKDIYSLPISNIKESFTPSTGQFITDPDGNELIMLRGTVYPIIRLHEIYSIEGAIENMDDAILILVDSGDKMACLMVDELIGKSQVVVKPIPAYLGEFNVKKSGVSGCTILGDGSISLILDVMEILS